MYARTFWGVLVGLSLTTTIGCTTGPNVVRGQNPGNYPSVYQTQESNQQTEPQIQAMPTYFEGSATSEPYMMYPQSHSSNGFYQHNGDKDQLFRYPKHHHVYNYKTPSRLVYPPANQPAAMVQYPYYTLRGPTDFFMK